MSQPTRQIDPRLQALVEARHSAPSRVLGRQGAGPAAVIRAFLPGAVEATVGEAGLAMERIEGTALFELRNPGYTLRIEGRRFSPK